MPNEKINPTSVTFEYGKNKSETVLSNWTGFTNTQSLTINKSCLSKSYFLEDKIAYIIDIKNNSDIPIFNVEIKENMGRIKKADNSDVYAPLKYADTFRYYLNGNIMDIAPPKTYSDKIIFEIEAIPALSTACIMYVAKITDNAPLEAKSSITNISSVIIPSTGKTLESSHTINVREIADIKTIKQIKNYSASGITYSIFIYNYGNIPAKNVTIKDQLENTFSSINIKVGSKNLNSTDYSITTTNDLQIPSYGSKYSISVPEAKFIRDEKSKKLGIIPGVVEATIDSKV